MSLPCDATAGLADRGQKVISFSTLHRTLWLVLFVPTGEKKSFTEGFKKKLTEKRYTLKALKKKNHLNMNTKVANLYRVQVDQIAETLTQ